MADPTNDPRGDEAVERELRELKQRHDKMREARVRAEQDLENISRQLDELQAQAREQYGTDDPAELERLLDEKRRENQQAVADYRKHLDEVAQGLNAVAQDLAREDDPQ